MKKRQWGIAAAALAVLLVSYLLMNFLSSRRKVPEQQASKPAVISVVIDTVVYKEVNAGLTASGRISSQAEVDLSSEVQGRLLAGELPFKKGQSFRKGQILLKVFDEDVSYALRSRKSSFLTSLANLLPDLKVDYPASYPEWLTFFNTIRINHDLPEMPDPKEEKIKIFLSSRGILSEYYGIKAEEVRLRKFLIKAPFDGIITETFMEAGSVTNAGSRLARIIHAGMLEVEVPVSASLAHRIRTGSAVTLKADGLSGNWDGRVVRRASFVDPLTQSVPIFVSIAFDQDRPLYQGQYLKVDFPEVKFDKGYSLPRSALFDNDHVYLVVDDRLVKQKINILHAGNTEVIVEGIEEGQAVVTVPLINVTENMRVEILH